MTTRHRVAFLIYSPTCQHCSWAWVSSIHRWDKSHQATALPPPIARGVQRARQLVSVLYSHIISLYLFPWVNLHFYYSYNLLCYILNSQRCISGGPEWFITTWKCSYDGRMMMRTQNEFTAVNQQQEVAVWVLGSESAHTTMFTNQPNKQTNKQNNPQTNKSTNKNTLSSTIWKTDFIVPVNPCPQALGHYRLWNFVKQQPEAEEDSTF